MIPVIGNDINDTFYFLCQQSLDWPIETRRGGDQLYDSPYPVLSVIANPQRRVLNVPFRNNSLPAVCAETLWVLAGRNDIEWLSFYLPRAKDFSDDGKTWRAAYGPRLRGFYDKDNGDDILRFADQLDSVVRELTKEPNSRRAVISIYDPVEDPVALIKGTKDFPCTQSLSFMVRNGKLDLTVFIRSNDLVWGWSGVNVFEFTVLQELVASMIGVPIGQYYHISNNLHVYQRHWKMVERIYKDCEPATIRYRYRDWKPPKYLPVTSIDQMDTEIASLFKIEPLIDAGTLGIDNFEKLFNLIPDKISLIDDMITVVLAYRAFKLKRFELSHRIRNMIIDNAMQESYDRYVAWEQRQTKED